MRRILGLFVVAAFGFTLFTGASTMRAGDKKEGGGEPPISKPGKEHEVLTSLEGVFNATVKMWAEPGKEPTTSTGVMTRAMIMDGRYLKEDFTGAFFGQTFKGMGVMTFDAKKKKYVSTWIDSMTTSIVMMEGTYDAAKKTMTMLGEDDSFGPKMKSRDIVRIISADEQVMEMFRTPPGAPEIKMMEITYKRKKSEK
jgi:hypothetical protein